MQLDLKNNHLCTNNILKVNKFDMVSWDITEQAFYILQVF